MITELQFDEICQGARPYDDVAWIGEDAAGQRAVFITAGFGQIPIELLRNYDYFCKASDAAEGAIYDGGIRVYDYSGQGQLDRSVPYTIQNPGDDTSDWFDGLDVQVARLRVDNFNLTDAILIDLACSETNV